MLQIEEFSSSVREIVLMNSAQIDWHWESICEALAEVPNFYDFYDQAWAYREAKMGLLQVWALSDGMIRGIVLTRMLVYPRQKVLEIMAMAGEGMLEYFETLEDVLERFAAAGECKTISCLTRPGIARKTRRHMGEVKASVVFRPVRAQKKDV